jgi:hypothetical protein
LRSCCPFGLMARGAITGQFPRVACWVGSPCHPREVMQGTRSHSRCVRRHR